MKINHYMIVMTGVPLAVLLLCLVSISVVVSSSREHIFTTVETAPFADAALILGAGVLRDGGLSPVLRDRADQAIDLYRAQKVSRIIASGNTATYYDEVEPMRNYLLKAGIPEDAIVLDRAGFDTYSSIYRARDVFAVQSLAIVSQSFHLPRAVFIARELNIDASGVSADRGHYKITNYFREMLADVKAVANLVGNRTPSSLRGELSIEATPPSEKFLFPLW